MKTALMRIPLYAGAALALSAFVTPSDQPDAAKEAQARQTAPPWSAEQMHPPLPDVSVSWHAVLVGKR